VIDGGRIPPTHGSCPRSAHENNALHSKHEKSGMDEQTREDIKDTERRWYVVHTYSGYENKVKVNLEHRIDSMAMKDKIFQIVVPTEEEVELKEGKKVTTKRKIFPGYVLVEMIMGEEPWYVVRNTPGVTGFVGTGNKPVPLQDHEVKAIIKQMKVETPKVKVGYSVGQSVKIIDGPFAEFMGVVDEINPERGKVKVLVSFFGRETPVELDFVQIARL
jgi:transcriptional antiterminator NusG